MNHSIDANKRFLKSVLNNFHEYGFSYRSVADGENETHGLTIDRTVEETFAVEAAHITLTNVNDRSRKIGLFIVLDHPQAPMDLINDFGAKNKDDLAIADRCIEGGSSA